MIHVHWELVPTSICGCGALDQIASHVIPKCHLRRAPKGYHGMMFLDDQCYKFRNCYPCVVESDRKFDELPFSLRLSDFALRVT